MDLAQAKPAHPAKAVPSAALFPMDPAGHEVSGEPPDPAQTRA
jgi:hypothetical protein